MHVRRGNRGTILGVVLYASIVCQYSILCQYNSVYYVIIVYINISSI